MINHNPIYSVLGLQLLCITNDDQLIYKKFEFILWKLSCIWMKTLNDIACNLNWIEIQFNTYLIEFELRNGMQIDAQGTKIWLWIWCWEKKTTFPSLFTLKLAKHDQSKGVTLRKSTESAMWAGSPPHRNGHERHPRYSVLYDFSLVGGGEGQGKAEETKFWCFFSTSLQLWTTAGGPFEYAKRTWFAWPIQFVS